jgi:hypothetical protein
MAIAISGQYVFRPPIRKGTVRGGSRLVGIIYPDTTVGKVFVPTTGEGFTHQELSEISRLVKNLSLVHRDRAR